MKSQFTKPTTWSMRPMRWVANPMKATISPTLASPCRFSQAPSAKMLMTVTVAAAPCRTLTTAHQLRTGNWAESRRSITSRIIRISADSRTKLCTSATLPMVSPARSASAVR